MSKLTFNSNYPGFGEFVLGGMTIGVSNMYQNSRPGETRETQLETVREMLETGKSAKTAVFTNCNGESEIRLKNDIFYLGGGQFGPTFGGHVNIRVSYSENKVEIDKFLNFLLAQEE